ncbi:MAG: aminoglycoside 6'-N-acetyltransferase I [Pseudohongiellaceae bacterium]|jgi:aminoglycoside 6'-N-acetyltransferase I
MNVRLKLSDESDAYIIQNMWPLYTHEVSEFAIAKPNRHGLLSDDENIATHEAQNATLLLWWRDPEALIPYLILADGHPAGFSLIAHRSRLPDTIDADFVVHEFFVMHA